jgi:hypothetical protein
VQEYDASSLKKFAKMDKDLKAVLDLIGPAKKYIDKLTDALMAFEGE